MGLAPLLHALDIGGAAELLSVLRFTQPASLTFGFAGLAAVGLGTKLLMMPIPAMGQEQLFAMQALTRLRLRHARFCTNARAGRKRKLAATLSASEEDGLGTSEEDFSVNLFKEDGT